MLGKRSLFGLGLLALLLIAFSIAGIPTERQDMQVPEQRTSTSYIRYEVDNGYTIKANWTYKAYLNGELVKDPFVYGSYFYLSSFTIRPMVNHYINMVIIDFTEYPDKFDPTYSYTIGTSSGTRTKDYNIPNNVTTTWVFTAPRAGKGIAPVDDNFYYKGAQNVIAEHKYARGSFFVIHNVTQNELIRFHLVDYGIQFNDPNIASSSYLFLLRPFTTTTSPSWSLVAPDGSTTTTSFSVVYSDIYVDKYTAILRITITYTGADPFTVKYIKVTFDGQQYGNIEFVNPIDLNNGDVINLEITINA